MLVLGLDPGLAVTGVAVIERGPAGLVPRLISTLRTDPAQAHADRLAALHSAVGRVLAEHKPDAVAIERLFFQTNVKTAMAVGNAAGAALAAVGGAGIPAVEYTPNEVKQAVAGVGSAGKTQVRNMITALLGLPRAPKAPDAADACALAICHLNRVRMARAVEQAVTR